jgi:BlaI family transcriptional regulator, penicillinase repressor
MARAQLPLSPLEHEVMAIVWTRGSATAAHVREALGRPLTNATVRTLLRRLETKGYVRHAIDGRSFVYEPKVAETQAGTGAVRRIVQRFFGGSAARLVAGLVDEGLIAPEEVRALSRRLARTSAKKKLSD